MALMIAAARTAATAGNSAATPESGGSDGSGGAVSSGGDAFAGVLAGIPDSGSRPTVADHPAKKDAKGDAAEAADRAGLAVLLLAPVLPPAGAFVAPVAVGAAAAEPSGAAGQPGVLGSAVSAGAPELAGLPSLTGPAVRTDPAVPAPLAPVGEPAPGATAGVPATGEPGATPTTEAAVASGPAVAQQSQTTAQAATAMQATAVSATGIHATAAQAAGVAATSPQPTAAQVATAAATAVTTTAATAAVSATPAASATAAAQPGKPASDGPVQPGPVSAAKPGGHRPARSAADTAKAADATTAAADPADRQPVRTGQEPAAASPQPVPSTMPQATAAQHVLAVQHGSGQPAPAAMHVGTAAGREADPARSAPTTEAPVSRQLATPLLALRAGGDGSHQLIVALHPAELGPVNLHVRIVGDVMTIQLASTSESAHDALRDALPQLRSELQSAGLGGVALSLDLTSGGSAGSGAFADPRQAAHDPSRSSRAAPVSELAQAAPRHRATAGRAGTHSSSGLDRWL